MWLFQAVESIDQLVYVCQADSSSTVRRKAKEALFSMGQSHKTSQHCQTVETGKTKQTEQDDDDDVLGDETFVWGKGVTFFFF